MDGYLKTISDCKAAGGKVEFGGSLIERFGGVRDRESSCLLREGNYVEPTIITGLPHDSPVVHRCFLSTPSWLPGS